MNNCQKIIAAILIIGGLGFGQINGFAQNMVKVSESKTIEKGNIKTIVLEVGGMTCQKGCADGIDKKLKTVNGVIKSKTNLETGLSTITYDEAKISVSTLIAIIEERGYTAKNKM